MTVNSKAGHCRSRHRQSVAVADNRFDEIGNLFSVALSEQQALRLEAELIAAFGTIDTGGLLTNTVMPSGLGGKSRQSIVLPSGVKEKAQLGLNLLKESVLELAKANPEGISNSDTASVLGLRSDYGGGSKDYLSYSVIGLLMREGKLERSEHSKKHIARVK